MNTINTEDIYKIVYAAIDELNEMQEEDEQLKKEPHAVLFSRPGYTEKGVLDSMGLVNLLMNIDEELDNHEKTVGINFDINEILEKKESILENVETLANYILKISQK